MKQTTKKKKKKKRKNPTTDKVIKIAYLHNGSFTTSFISISN